MHRQLQIRKSLPTFPGQQARRTVQRLFEQTIQEGVVEVVAGSQILMDVVRQAVEEIVLLTVGTVDEMLRVRRQGLGQGIAAFKGGIRFTAAAHVNEEVLIGGLDSLLQSFHITGAAAEGQEIGAHVQHLVKEETGPHAAA